MHPDRWLVRCPRVSSNSRYLSIFYHSWFRRWNDGSHPRSNTVGNNQVCLVPSSINIADSPMLTTEQNSLMTRSFPNRGFVVLSTDLLALFARKVYWAFIAVYSRWCALFGLSIVQILRKLLDDASGCQLCGSIYYLFYPETIRAKQHAVARRGTAPK